MKGRIEVRGSWSYNHKHTYDISKCKRNNESMSISYLPFHVNWFPSEIVQNHGVCRYSNEEDKCVDEKQNGWNFIGYEKGVR